MKKRWVDPDDAPPLTGDEIHRPGVKWRIGGKEVSREEGMATFRSRLKGKTRVNTHIDNDLIAHYKSKAPEGGYQTLINAALRRDVEGEILKAEIAAMLDAQEARLLSAMQQMLFSFQSAQLTQARGIQALAIWTYANSPEVSTELITQGSSQPPVLQNLDS